MNFTKKYESGAFSEDITPLLAPNIEWNFEMAANEVYGQFIERMPGKKWKG